LVENEKEMEVALKGELSWAGCRRISNYGDLLPVSGRERGRGDQCYCLWTLDVIMYKEFVSSTNGMETNGLFYKVGV
jgi:hypothetical protein